MRAPPQPRTGSGIVDVVLWAASVGMLVATFVLSLGPAPPGLSAFFASDKLIHAAGYAALTGCWLLAAVWRPGRGDGPLPGGAWLVVAGVIVLGAGIEVGQHFVDRSTDAFDALADAGGALVALWAWADLRRRVAPSARTGPAERPTGSRARGPEGLHGSTPRSPGP